MVKKAKLQKFVGLIVVKKTRLNMAFSAIKAKYIMKIQHIVYNS